MSFPKKNFTFNILCIRVIYDKKVYLLKMLKDNSKKFKYTDVLSSSEIGQYYFCSISWYLQKQGFKPVSPFLESGIKKHEQLGKIIDQTQNKTRFSNILKFTGYCLLISAVLIFVFEVVI